MKIIVTGGAGFIGGNFVHHMAVSYTHLNFRPVIHHLGLT